MPNNNVISQEQRRKCICFLVAAAQGKLEEVKKNCDAYTLNAMDAKRNTALHLASENAHDDILEFLFNQPHIDCHQVNSAGKKAVDVITHLSTAELWQELLSMQKNALQASVLLQKNQLKKTILLS